MTTLHARFSRYVSLMSIFDADPLKQPPTFPNINLARHFTPW